jgi:hypothetical protein
MRRDFLKVIALGGVAAALSGCWGDDKDLVVWRQKLTVTVGTPSGDVVGSAVSEGAMKNLYFLGQPGSLSGAMVTGRITQGEATVVDLGGGKFLFALLGPNDDTLYLPFYTFLEDFPGGYSNSEGNTYVNVAQKFAVLRGPRAVPSAKLPLLVTFKDINNLKTVKVVKPGNFYDAFGTGYYLKSITLEITDEDVEKGKVEKVLRWVSTLQGALVPTKLKPSIDYKTEETLSPFHFVRNL